MLPQSALPPAPSLTISLFGPWELTRDGTLLPRTRTRKEQWLLTLLVLRRQQAIDRNWLAGLLWPDTPESSALSNLRRSLADLRKILGLDASALTSPSSRTLRLDTSGMGVDLVEFDSAIASGDPAALARGVALYRGTLLEGCYEEWVLPERESREQAYLRALETLASDAIAREDPTAALGYLRRIIVVDPLRDSAQRSLMEVLASTQDYAAASQVFREFRVRLSREMNTPPAPETTALYQQLRSRAHHTTAAVPAAAPLMRAAPVNAEGSTRIILERSGSRTSSASSPDSLSVCSLPGRLPHPLSSMVGREAEISIIKAGVGQSRLLTLTGTGGVGKTRLAIQVARETSEEYRDGAWFVDLAPLSDSSLVAQTTASALGIGDVRGRPIRAVLLDYLRNRSLLLVLDNCEHLIDGCARLAETILSECPRVRILATSREPLSIGGEALWRVPSLSLPLDLLPSNIAPKTPQEWNTPERWDESEALQLFVERVTQTKRAFRVTPENLRAAAEVCCHLDGIPLALELAAARTKMLSIQEIAAGMGDRFRLLTGGSRTALPRQQTLRAAIDWSYALLDEKEKALFGRLSVFAGGFTLEVAEAVCAGEGVEERDVLELVGTLAEKSLVSVIEQQEGIEKQEGTRYRLLETIRQYAGEKLVSTGDEELTRGKHGAYFQALGDMAERERGGPTDTRWRRRLQLEQDNLRAALGWSLEREPEAAVKLAGDLWTFWEASGSFGHLTEGRQWLERVLVRGDRKSDAGVKALHIAGMMAFDQGDWEISHALLEEELAIQRVRGDWHGIADSLAFLGLLTSDQGDWEKAYALIDEALTIQRAHGDWHGTAYSLAGLGRVAAVQGDYNSARALSEESLAIQREHGNPGGIFWSLISLGKVATRQGDYETARPLFKESLSISREMGQGRLVAFSLDAAGRLASAAGQPEVGIILLGAAEALREETRTPVAPQDKKEHDQMEAELRASLGEETFTATWSKGRAMTLEQAIGLALRQEDSAEGSQGTWPRRP